MDKKFLLSEQDRQTLQYKVTTKLREVILKGEFKWGDRLIQEEWAAKLGVSRMPIRDALRQLEIEGLVRIEPRRGAIVIPITAEDIEEIYHLRALLEGEALERSIPYLEQEDLQTLEDYHEKMQALGKDEDDIREYMELNKEFHKVLYQGCPWRRIHQMIDILWTGIPLYTPSIIPDRLQDAHKEHEEIITAIKNNRTKEARVILENHILRTKQHLLSVIGKNEGDKK